MSNFLFKASRFTPKEEPLVQADLDSLAEIVELLPKFELWELPEAQQDRAGQVYTRLTGRNYNKLCKSCQVEATHKLRSALQQFTAIRSHQKMVPSQHD